MEKNIGKLFLEKTKFQNLSASDQMKGVPSPPLEIETAPDQPRIDLPRPEPQTMSDISVKSAIENRQSIRNYSKKPSHWRNCPSCSGVPKGSNTYIRDLDPYEPCPLPVPAMPWKPIY